MTTLHNYATDTELLAVYARQRDAEAFAELARRYAGLVYGVGLRITRNPADAEDVTQECFLALANHATAGKPLDHSLPAWLHTLARSRAIDATRRAAARQRHERAATEPARSPALTQWEALQPHVDRAIAELPAELRDLVMQHYLCGVSQAELAIAKSLSQPTVSRRLAEAIERLRAELDQSGVGLSVVALTDTLTRHGQPQIPPSLTATLGKMAVTGVAGSATSAASAGAKTVSRTSIAASVAVCTALGGLVYWQATTGHPATPAPTTQENAVMPPADTQASRLLDVVRRDNGKVWIEGLQSGQRNTSPYAQGMALLLQHLGHHDADYTRVMGYSGVAFALQMDLRGPLRDGKYDVAWWPNDCYVFDLSIPRLSRAFGRELRIVRADPAAPAGADYRRVYQDRFEPAIIAAIDQGFPVLGQQDAAYLITGYDRANHKPIGLWPTPGQPVFGPADDGIPWGLFIPGKAVAALPQDQAEIESLRWAVALWDETAAATTKEWDTSKLLTGSKAYATWLEFLQGQAEGKGPGQDSWDNNLMIHLRYNRRAAVAYLRDVATRQPAAAAERLKTAANLYQEVLDDTATAPFWGQFEKNPELRPQKLQEYTQIVRRASQTEARAIDEIRKALPAVKPPQQ